MLFNPFRPNNMVGPDMFVGRVMELRAVEKCLFQTLNENPQHFLIEGERGIGKSSLLLYLSYLARGEATGLQYDGFFNFVCVSIDLGKCKSQLHIIQKIAKGFKQEIGRKNEVKEKASAVWDWLTDWEIMGVKFNKKDVDFDPDLAGQELVTQISNFLNAVDSIDGVVFLLDEADSPDTSADLGNFLKMTTERLQREGCNKVVFGLAGLPQMLGKLSASHESSPRLFQILTLETLEVSEREHVVSRALERANTKNDTDITISDDAMEELCNMSEGYPHFLQQFAYCAFDANIDAEIDIGDLMSGAFGSNGAIDQLGAKFFNEMYNARISSDDYRTVLDTMANHSDSWVKKETIQSESGVIKHTVGNALKALRTKNIIAYDDSRMGYYRLPTKSFAVWINATKRTLSN